MAWTSVPKPTETSIVSAQPSAEPFGLLIAITSVTGAAATSVTSGWTGIVKPTSSVWTAVIKPTSSVWAMIAKPTT